jgi:hypothetical protein
MLTPDVVEFLQALLSQQSLQVGHPKFAEMSALSLKALAQLADLEPPPDVD